VLLNLFLISESQAFQSPNYEITSPSKSWKEMENFVGTDVSMVNVMTPGRVHVFSVATISSPNALGRESEFLDEEAAKMGRKSGRKNFEVIKKGKVKGAPKNHYIEMTYSLNGIKMQEIYVLFANKEKQHYVYFADTAENYPTYYEEFLTMARSFELR
jgi:hypothetical protein